MLRQGRPTLNRVAGQQVGRERAGETNGVDAEMRIEPPVLDGDDGLGDEGRHVLEGKRLAAGGAAVGKRRPVHGVYLDVGRAGRDLPRAGARHARSIVENDAGNADAAPQGEHQTPVYKPTDKADEAKAFAALRSVADSATPAPGSLSTLGIFFARLAGALSGRATDYAIVGVDCQLVVIAVGLAGEGRFDALT